MLKMENIPLDKFNKCGELYRSPKINDKQYLLLSCIYCNNISWELSTFLQHLDKIHSEEDEVCLNFYKGEIDRQENSGLFKNCTESGVNCSLTKVASVKNCENDPLDEKHYDYNELFPAGIKIEKADIIAECDEVKLGIESTGKRTEIIIKHFGPIVDTNCVKDNDYNRNLQVHEPNNTSTSNKNGGYVAEYLNAECEKDVTDNTDSVNICSKNLSLKHLTKNRDFIKAIINSYKEQNILWDRTYKTNRDNAQEKKDALKTVLKHINGSFNVNLTQQQIERIIKRLKLRYAHHLRLREKGESFKPLWFFKQLSYLEPHLNTNKMKNYVFQHLDDSQILTLIKILEENECFWNENNIYHTSVTNKQEILKRITADFLKRYEMKDFNVDVMQSSIDEIIEIARNENANKMQYLESYGNGEYQPRNKFYKYMGFLLPHIGPFKCKYCSKVFTDVYAYKFHISRHEGTKPFKCMECPRELTHKKEFVCHLRRHTKECPFQCNNCDKSFPSQKEWHRHVVKHGSKPYVCELCADSFYTQHQLTNHMKNHNNIRDHVCPECGKGFTHRGLLRQHLQTHNKTKCYCTACDNIYSNPRSLRKHYVRVHESGQQQSTASKAQYNCQICKITFSTIQDAKKHRKEHKQSNPTERKHMCDICGHHFAYPRNLADHKKTHSNIRDQVCDICGKAFTNSNLLNQHKNVHTGEKFVCKACGKDYAHYRGLCRHITKVHSTNIRDLDALLEKQNMSSSFQ